jgi:hypothetical protein
MILAGADRRWREAPGKLKNHRRGTAGGFLEVYQKFFGGLSKRGFRLLKTAAVEQLADCTSDIT